MVKNGPIVVKRAQFQTLLLTYSTTTVKIPKNRKQPSRNFSGPGIEPETL